VGENPPLSGSQADKGLTFEDFYFRRNYFMGEFQLTNVLMSLLSLLDCCSLEQNGELFYLVNKSRLEKKIHEANRLKEFRKNTSGKDPLGFCLSSKIRLDSILGEFPVCFRRPKLFFHALKFSFAIFTTLRIYKLDTCLKVPQRLRKEKFTSLRKNLLPSLFLNAYRGMESSKSEVLLIKRMKNSLCNLVSDVLDNERTEGESFNVLPPFLYSQILRILGKERFIEFAYSCLQSKVLCMDVDESFILETLVKHQKQMQDESVQIDSQTLDLLKQRGREFGKNVEKFYKPHKGFNPTPKATFEFTQLNGGVKGDLIFHNRLRDKRFEEDPDDRSEPMVIGLFGQPGQGKSTRLNDLVAFFSGFFPYCRYEDLIYTKSCHVEHWDGYDNQPIVVYDDLGQSTEAKDIREFQTLVSCAPYVVPMADLPEKGKKFSSPIIIVTTNIPYLHDLNTIYAKNNPIILDSSFWRRFHYPILVEQGKVYHSKITVDFFDHCRSEGTFSKEDRVDLSMHSLRKMNFERYLSNGTSIRSRVWEASSMDKFLHDIKELWKFRRSFHSNHSAFWTQDVKPEISNTEAVLGPLFDSINSDVDEIGIPYIEGSSLNKQLRFPAYPPVEPLCVRVEPIIEPLKVRTITAGQGDTFCLKPFQVAMWQALGLEDQFCLTHGTQNLKGAIERIYAQSNEGDVWISGDYSAATDSIPLAATRAVLEGILESIDHLPTKRWALKEISPHVVVYPKKSGLKPVLQRSGQLMGSLLSFPILCLINDCTAKFSGLKPSQYLINGDDILMRCQPDRYDVWKGKTREFGFILSPGKNYIHPRFGTVNSQLIRDGEVLFSGKQRVLERRSKFLGECLRDWEIYREEESPDFAKRLFVVYNAKKLKETCRSISIPTSHGGLGFFWSKRITQRDLVSGKLCYLSDLFDKIEPLKDCVSIPFLTTGTQSNQRIVEDCKVFNEPLDRNEAPERFITRKRVSEIRSRIHGNEILRKMFKSLELYELPSLSFVSTIQVPVSCKKDVRKKIQSIVDGIFFKRFFSDMTQDFGYYTFAHYYRSALDGINLEPRMKILLDLRDLPSELIININPSLPEFSRTEFERKFFGEGNTFKRKEFDIPKFESVEDYSMNLLNEEVRKLTDLDEEMKMLVAQVLGVPELEWIHRPSWEASLMNSGSETFFYEKYGVDGDDVDHW
jgi:hypothetical protein